MSKDAEFMIPASVAHAKLFEVLTVAKMSAMSRLAARGWTMKDTMQFGDDMFSDVTSFLQEQTAAAEALAASKGTTIEDLARQNGAIIPESPKGEAHPGGLYL